MPKLTRIRITGSKYEGFQKRHENSIFELAGAHTLFTLQNGNGKGVMLQLISQIMLPGTSWGNNNGNRVEGMFYDRYNVFKPYTFHVVLEWSLDSDPEKRLLAGICVSARRQKYLDDSEGKVGLKYFLYTHEYKGESRFSLRNLPLYSKSAGGVLSYETMESFIDENQYDFRKYSMTSVSSLNSDYYQYMASYGIYRSEWDIMRIINRSEGGLEKHFSRAKDNQALFDKLIIPAVSESINSRSEENSENSLINMFVDNIKIAENLPELISRTEDINRLLKMVEPLLIDAEEGTKLGNTGDIIWTRGNNYLRILRSRLVSLQSELDHSKKEQEKAKTRVDELRYEEQNLKYARRIRIFKELEEEKTGLEQEIALLEKRLIELTGREKKLILNQHFLAYQQDQKEYRQIKGRIKDLENSTDLSNLRGEIARISNMIKEEWPELESAWEESSRYVNGYLKHLDLEAKRLRQEGQELEDNIRDRELIIYRFKDQEAKFKEWQERLATSFNPLQLSTPAYLVEQLSHDLKEKRQKLNGLKNSREELEIAIENLREKKNQQEIELARQEIKYQKLEQTYQARKSREEAIFAKIVNLLELDKFKEVFSSDWLIDKRLRLEGLLEEKSISLQELNKKNHELGLDLALNAEDYWIANSNQKRLYQQISALDIKVYYGSDFLINLVDDQEKYLHDYPLLPYSLILMYEGDWEKVERNLSVEDVFRAPVPVFINYQLEEEKVAGSFKLVHGREKGFITRPESFRDWYIGLTTEQKEIASSVVSVEDKMDHIRQVIFNANELFQEEYADDLARELTTIAEKIKQLKEEIDNTDKKLAHLTEERDGLEKRIADREDRLEKLKEEYQEIKKYAEEFVLLEKRRPEVEKIKEGLVKLEERKKKNDTEQWQNIELQLEIKNGYKNWLKELKGFLAEIQEIIPESKFNEQLIEKQSSVYPELFDYHDSGVYYHYQQLLDLERKEEEKNGEIKYLRKDQDRLRDDILAREERMKTLDPDWQAYSFEPVGEPELKINLERVTDEISQQKGKIKDLDKRTNILAGEIKGIKNEVDELSKEIKEHFSLSAQPWFELDLDRKEQEIKSSLQESRVYLEKLRGMIEENQDRMIQINNLINKLGYYQLDADKGEYNSQLEEEVRYNPGEVVEQWVKDYQEFKEKLEALKERTGDDFYQFKRNVNELVNNDILKSSINEKIIENFRSDAYGYNCEMLNSFRDYLRNELNRLDDDKSEAERARNQWAERSAMRVIRIITSLREMINNMVYHNQKGYAFPLVRLRRSDLLPDSEEEIISELKGYFVEVLDKFNREGIKVDRLTDSQLKEYSGDAALFSRSIRGRYPVLQVYKMTERNEFLYARPADYYFADWESVIQGKGDTPEGSGGQSLSINAFMMMMLLNYKKQRLDQSNPWTVLFLDNPFGKASAAHVLDPIFKIANKLNFQIVALAAPEIVKTEISERFPVFWALEISDDEKGHGVIKGQVIYGERIRKTTVSI